jgi:hypothetical protein
MMPKSNLAREYLCLPVPASIFNPSIFYPRFSVVDEMIASAMRAASAI